MQQDQAIGEGGGYASGLLSWLDGMAAVPERACALLVLLSLACFLPGFFTIPPVDRDETRFAQATKQMVETGDYIDIRNQDRPRHKKPAGIHWLQAAAVHASGQGAEAPVWVYRLPSLVGAVAVVLLTYWMALAVAAPPVALFAAMLMAGSLLLGVEARLAKTDAVLNATILTCCGVIVRIWLDRAGRMGANALAAVFWIAAAIGVMVKGPILPLVVGLFVAVLCIVRRSARWLAALRPLPGILIFLLLALPWYVAIAIQTDGGFLRNALFDDALGKITEGQQSHGAPPGTYLLAILITGFPFIAPLLVALPWIWRERRRDVVTVLLAWIVPTWIVFELITTKLPHYVLPVYPALAILAAIAVFDESLRTGALWKRAVVISAVLALVYGPLTAIGVHVWLEGSVPWIAIGLLAILAAAAVPAIIAAWQGELRRSVTLTILVLPVFYLAIYETVLARLESVQIAPRIAAIIATETGCAEPDVMATEFREMSLVFALGTRTRWGTIDDAAQHLSETACAVVITGSRNADTLMSRGDALGIEAAIKGRVPGLNIGNGQPVDLVVIEGRKRP